MDYTEKIRRLAIGDEQIAMTASLKLDPKSLALVRIASLVAAGGAIPSYGSEVDAALGAGAMVDEIVDVLVAVIPVVGLPCVVEAAPKLAVALGYDTEQSL